jgi:hypothetical protein
MIRIRFCLAAEGIVRDSETNNMSAFNILEQMTPEGFPALLPKISFLSAWERDPEDPAEYDMEFTTKLDEDVLYRQPITLRFGDSTRHRQTVIVQGLQIPRFGKLIFMLRTPDGSIEASYSIEVKAPAIRAEQA